MKKLGKLLLIVSILCFVYAIFYFIFFFLLSNGVDFIIGFSFILLIVFLYKQLASYIYITLLNIHKDIWIYYISLFTLFSTIKTMILTSNKLFMDMVERKISVMNILVLAFDNALAEMNFFFLNKFLLNKYLSLLLYRLNFINSKTNEVLGLPFFLNSYYEYDLYKSYEFIFLLKILKSCQEE